MASATAEEITEIFNEVMKENLLYCAICLKTSKERKLMKTDSFSTCLKLFKLKVLQNNLVCHMCEALMARTVQMFHLASFAVAIDSCFKEMQAHVKWIEKGVMPEYLQRVMNVELSDRTLPLERAWRLVRARADLAQTDVLRINSDTMETEEPEFITPDIIPLKPPTPVPIAPVPIAPVPITPVPITPVPITPVPIAPVPIAAKNPEIDSIVIIDDDDPPKTPTAPRLVSIETLLEDTNQQTDLYSIVPNEMQIMGRDKHDPNSFILHPIETASDGSLHVPSINCELSNEQLLPIKAPKQLKPRVVPATANNSLKIMVVSPLNMNNQNSTDKKTAQKDLQENVIPTYTVNVSGSLGISDVDGFGIGRVESVKSEVEPAVTHSADPVSKQAVMVGRIDWEDKIPMDVISFMDATDPNAAQVLSDVLAPPAPPPPLQPPPPLTPAPPARAQNKKRKVFQDCDVVIDLC